MGRQHQLNLALSLTLPLRAISLSCLPQLRPALPDQPRCHQHLCPIGITHSLHQWPHRSLCVIARLHQRECANQVSGEEKRVRPVVVCLRRQHLVVGFAVADRRQLELVRGKSRLALVEIHSAAVVMCFGKFGWLALKRVDRMAKRFQGFTGTPRPSEQRGALLQQGATSRRGKSGSPQRTIKTAQGMVEIRLIRGKERHG
ncbi:hypothetical protein ACIO3S_00300 [Nocardioides sp. NPDC087217]|uniref:hypothetical protein n=1 Tax=Nocardioides sp. NPDC087217 TaxID=3364335 RepID=UPI0037FD6717